MKTNRLIQTLAGILAFALCVPTVFAQNAPKMKMTTQTPAGIATPDKLETRIGALTSVDGIPDAETAQDDNTVDADFTVVDDDEDEKKD